MEIGECLRDKRLKLGLTIAYVALDARITPDKLSRIEKGTTQPTLSITRTLCDVLNIDLPHLLECIGSDVSNIKQSHPSALEGKVLTPSLAAKFLSFIAREVEGGVELLADLWRELESEDSDMQYALTLGTPNSSIEALVTHFLRHYRSIQMDLNYPPDLNAQTIVEIHRAGGVLTFPEIGIINKSLRHQGNRTLAEFAKKGGRSLQIVSRLESGQALDVRLKDILMLDEVYEQGGEIVQMYWAAVVYKDTVGFEQDPFVGSTIDFHRAVYLFVSLCRWKQFKHGDDIEWLNRLNLWCDSVNAPWDKQEEITTLLLEQYELTQEQWAFIKGIFAHSEAIALEDSDYQVLGGINFKYLSGWNWERLPAKYGSSEKCREQYFAWCREGKWQAIWNAFRHIQTAAQQERWMSTFRRGGILPIEPTIVTAKTD